MSTTKWTPGPWSHLAATRRGFMIYAEASPWAIVTSEDAEGRYGAIDSEANARLVAAAPELYEALEEVLMHASFPPQEMQSGEDPFPAHAAIINARAALAKARGEA